MQRTRSRKVPGKVSKRISKTVSKKASKRISKRISKKISKKISRKISKVIAKGAPKKAPRKTSKNGSQTKREIAKPVVGVVYGSPSDEPFVAECVKILEERLRIPCERKLLSAHRMPDATRAYGRSAPERGLRVIIAMAGMAAHLPGVLASLTTLPVLGVPLPGPHIEGMDALLSMAQMPAGVPVGTLAIGKAGAKNAALLAARILALEDTRLAQGLDRLGREMEEGGRV